MIRPRDDEGNVANTQMYELTGDMESPMPMELMYIQRLRLLFHLMQVADDFMIHAVIKKNVINSKSQSQVEEGPKNASYQSAHIL